MLSQILALIIAIVLFSALLQGKYPRYLLTLAAGALWFWWCCWGRWAARLPPWKP